MCRSASRARGHGSSSYPCCSGVIGHRVLTVNTPIGRKMRPKLLSHGPPLVRVKPKDLAAAGMNGSPESWGCGTDFPCWRTNESSR